MTLRTWNTGLIVLCISGVVGCEEEESRPEPNLDASVQIVDAAQPAVVLADGGVVAEVDTPATLDVLFVIDNSGSMASEQAKLAREIPRMVHVLTSGDRYAGREEQVPPGLSEKSRRFTPVRSLHLGVVSTNFGGVPDVQPHHPAAILSCGGHGDGGKLLSDTKVAVEGVFAGKFEFQFYEKDEVVIPPDPSCAQGVQPRYQSFGANADQAAVGAAFACVARIGVRGCPFEQPLESMWNALAPQGGKGDLFTFVDGARGQGDAFNAGFLREGAALAVVLLTDEDDCSVTDEGRDLFALSQDANDNYGPLNLRCYTYGHDEQKLRAAERYRDGLLSLKAKDPRRVLFTAIAGIPEKAITDNNTPEQILALPEMRFAEDVQSPGIPMKTCRAEGTTRPEEAYPARRLVKVAGLMNDAGLLESICAPSYAPVIDRLVNKIAPLMGE